MTHHSQIEIDRVLLDVTVLTGHCQQRHQTRYHQCRTTSTAQSVYQSLYKYLIIRYNRPTKRTVFQKNFPLCHRLQSLPSIDRFSKVLHCHILRTIGNKTVTKCPTAHHCVATLLDETWMSENLRIRFFIFESTVKSSYGRDGQTDGRSGFKMLNVSYWIII